MSQSLPVGEFEWVNPDEFDINIIKNCENSDLYGYFLEVDLEYPNELHDLHNDYPLAPETIMVTDDMLSDYQKQSKRSKVNKLVPNLGNKTKYVIHIRNLKFYLANGLKLIKIHRVIKFKQQVWLKPYIDFNTEKRQQAPTTSGQDFFKLKNNAAFGKTMENVRNRVTVEVVNNITRRNKIVAKPNFEYMNIINENLAVMKFKKTCVHLNKPIYCGFAVLELSKLHMFNFHYNIIKKQYGNKAKLLYTDTDSLIYEIETEDVYKDMYSSKELYDLSGFDKKGEFYDPTNNRVVGKFKDETSGVPIIEFVGLRSKMYTIKLEGGDVKKRAKGIKTNVVEKNIKHEDYKTILEATNGKNKIKMNVIRSVKHQINSYQLTKIGLSQTDDKRFIREGIHDTLALFHYKTKEFSQNI